MTALSSSTTANDGASSSTTKTSSANENTSKSYLYVPSERDEHYKGNVAQYLLDLNDEVRTLRILYYVYFSTSSTGTTEIIICACIFTTNACQGATFDFCGGERVYCL